MAKLSIVTPAFNEEDGITHFLRKLESELSLLASQNQFEIVVVNDGSSDLTESKVLEYCSPNVILVNLVSNSGHMAALEAGLRYATGDLIVTMDSDLQHPPSLILEMLNIQRETKCDVVLAERKRGKDETFLRRWSSILFYRALSKITEIEIHNNVADFRLMTRSVVNTLINVPEKQKVFRFLISALGFKVEKLEFVAPQRQFGKSKYSIKHLVKFAIEIVIGFSIRPLIWIFTFGVFFLIIASCYLMFLITSYLSGRTLQGWTSLMFVLVTFSSFQLLAIGVIGRYLGQVLIEIRGRPNYLIRNTHDSEPLGDN
jgi:polyisoprenyl-phosphate glycosyltransferase